MYEHACSTKIQDTGLQLNIKVGCIYHLIINCVYFNYLSCLCKHRLTLQEGGISKKHSEALIGSFYRHSYHIYHTLRSIKFSDTYLQNRLTLLNAKNKNDKVIYSSILAMYLNHFCLVYRCVPLMQFAKTPPHNDQSVFTLTYSCPGYPSALMLIIRKSEIKMLN